ncbi:MAG TPA: hypothetical protein VJ891_01140 [Casimicrobiaceae bacterium]|nr:hypothetical protein [Casimicrobiaceae bacterium]
MSDALVKADAARELVASAHSGQLQLVLRRDERAWREFVECYDPPLRAIVRDASEVRARPLTPDAIDDVMADFWTSVVESDLRLLRAFNPARGASLLTWLTFHVAQLAHDSASSAAREPEFVPLHHARNVLDPRSAPTAKLRGEVGGSIDAAIRDCVRTTVEGVVREQLASAFRAREVAESDRPRPAAWWAEQLGCTAESLIKRAKRGTLEATRIGCRFYFTQAQIDGSRRWQRARRGHSNDT